MPVTCDECGDYHHKGCISLKYTAANEISLKRLRWSCDKCRAVRGDYIKIKGGTSIETSASLKPKVKELELRLAAWVTT